MYERKIGEQLFSFGNLGFVVDRAMAMYDAETGSSWNQATGIAMTGTHAGTQLVVVPASTTSLGAWLASYPNSGVIAPSSELTWRQKVRIWDPAVADSLLLVVQIGPLSRAYPLSRFPESGLLHDTLGDEPIALLFGRRPKVLAAYSRRVGAEVIELDARPVTEDIELLERGGRRRWSAVSGRSRPLRSARPLRKLACLPIDRAGLELNYRGIDLFGGPLPPAPGDGERATATTPAAPVPPAAPLPPDPAPPPPSAPQGGESDDDRSR
ncbi:MAG: DUF3179 domain-containing protein [Planctomycetes bacterium]|nr:DUF3179 domain-containing protein [Planctomycetota bacterium]